MAEESTVGVDFNKLFRQVKIRHYLILPTRAKIIGQILSNLCAICRILRAKM
jgi:hypothetical protein